MLQFLVIVNLVKSLFLWWYQQRIIKPVQSIISIIVYNCAFQPVFVYFNKFYDHPQRKSNFYKLYFSWNYIIKYKTEQINVKNRTNWRHVNMRKLKYVEPPHRKSIIMEGYLSTTHVVSVSVTEHTFFVVVITIWNYLNCHFGHLIFNAVKRREHDFIICFYWNVFTQITKNFSRFVHLHKV